MLLLSQSSLATERRAEYAHEAKAVLSFLDREFWDVRDEGFYSNPYGRPVKLSHEQALVALAHFALYNATGDRRHLERAETIMRYLSFYDSPYGGCQRGIDGPARFNIQEQAIVMRAYLAAYKATGKDEYKKRYSALANFILTRLTELREGSCSVWAWWDAENLSWSPASGCLDYFEPAISLFQAFGADGNQTLLEAGKRILAASNQFWDEDNYGYSHGLDDNKRYCWDHATAVLAFLSAYDQTNRKDYLQRAVDILFYMVARMGDQVTRTFYQAIAYNGEVEPRRRTSDHLLTARAYLYAYEVTLEERYLNQGQSLLDSILGRAYDKDVGSFMDQVGGGVMGDLQVQAQGALALVDGYRLSSTLPSPLIVVFVVGAMAGLVGLIVYLFRKSWPY